LFFGFPAGSCATIGVSGHLMGGGYGALTRKYGSGGTRISTIDRSIENESYKILRICVSKSYRVSRSGFLRLTRLTRKNARG
jgi:hypothetical protein